MRKIIDQRVYDTEKAEQIASTWYGTSYDDFSYLEEILYRTKNGALFLYASGGPMSRMGKSMAGNGSCGSSDITAYDNTDAISWLIQAHENGDISADEYIDATAKIAAELPIEA